MLSILERCPSCGALMVLTCCQGRQCRHCRARARWGDTPVALANLTPGQALFAAKEMWYLQGFRG